MEKICWIVLILMLYIIILGWLMVQYVSNKQYIDRLFKVYVIVNYDFERYWNDVYYIVNGRLYILKIFCLSYWVCN